MKTILAILALLLTTSAHADCNADLLAKFEVQRAQAIDMYPQYAARLATVTAHMDRGGEVPATAWGATYPRKNIIAFGLDLCDMAVGYRNSVVAHEIGHIIADAEHPEMLIHEMQFPTRHNYARDEDMARYYGAKLIDADDRANMMDFLATECSAGHDHYCKLEASWQYGFTH